MSRIPLNGDCRVMSCTVLVFIVIDKDFKVIFFFGGGSTVRESYIISLSTFHCFVLTSTNLCHCSSIFFFFLHFPTENHLISMDNETMFDFWRMQDILLFDHEIEWTFLNCKLIWYHLKCQIFSVTLWQKRLKLPNLNGLLYRPQL